MKRSIQAIFIVILIIAAVFVFIKPAIVFFAKKQLAEVFINSSVSVGGCSLNPANRLSFFDIGITRKGVYDIKVKEAVIRFNLFSILKPSPFKIHLKNAEILVNAPKSGIGELAGYIRMAPGAAPVAGSVEVSDLTLDLNTGELTLKAVLSSGIDIVDQSINYLEFNADTFKMKGAELDKISLEIARGSGKGGFSVKTIKYNKLTLEDIKGKIAIDGKELSLQDISARTLEGDLYGGIKLAMDKEPRYSATLKCADLKIERFVKDFELHERFNMTGSLTGELALRGRGAQIEILGGSFAVSPPGGILTITDTRILQNLAQKTQQPMDLLVESFKNYSYNTGLMGLSLKEGNIVLKVNLDGQAGKRDLELIWHNFGL